MFLESKVTEIAIGQIRGFVKPSKAERLAAFELFVELSVRVTTPSIEDQRGMMRDDLDNLAAIGAVTREILRKHGCEAAKSRNDGNITLAVVALRVYNEIILPRLIAWEPLLRDHEGVRLTRDPPVQPYEWEQGWDQISIATFDLDGMRREIRSYMDTLAAIAGTPSLTDLVVPLPPSAPIDPVSVARISAASEGLGAPRERMVRWFSPWEALGTFRANRGRHPGRPGARDRHDRQPQCTPITIEGGPDGETWIDYVSDLGDGFDPTMAVAFQLTRPSLTLPIDRSGELPQPPGHLPRGRLLVMGGDEVYPHSTAEGYRRQTILPYHIAAEAQRGDDPPPDVAHNDIVAIPGNHDWYGGPEHFEDVFVHADQFAGHYRARQSERWWAVQLPKGWWMWGIDTALDNTMNDDQIAYFRQAAALLREGDRVIICSPVPFWQLRQKRQADYFALRSFLRTEILQRGARTPLFLSGDSHFFAHYWRVDGVTDEHHITAGGGGAFMQPTHNLPEQVPYETGAPEFKLGARWPRPVESRSLGASLGSIKDPQFRSLFVMIALVHALFAGLVTIRLGALDKVRLPVEAADSAARWVIAAWPGWPILALLLIAMTFATAPNSRESHLVKGSKRYGLIHGAIQAALFVAVAAFARLVGPEAWWWRFFLVPLIGGVLSTVLFVMAVRWTNRSIKANDTLAFSSAHLTRYKHFVRMRINAEGDLDVYVIGIDPVGTGWYRTLRDGGLVPPYDARVGISKLHYVWGRTFSNANAGQLVERVRTLGLGHPETLYAAVSMSQRLLGEYRKNPEQGSITDIVENLRQAVSLALVTHGVTHRTTITYGEALAEALIVAGGELAAEGRSLMVECAEARLANDLLEREPDGVPSPASAALHPATVDAYLRTTDTLVLANLNDDAQKFLSHAFATLHEHAGLGSTVDLARLEHAAALVSLARDDHREARSLIDRGLAALSAEPDTSGEIITEAIATSARVRCAELNDPYAGEPTRPPLAAARIEELTELLNGPLRDLPDTHPAALELRMALAKAHQEDGYLAGAKSWLEMNAYRLTAVESPAQLRARLLNAQRLDEVLKAMGDSAASRSLQRQIIDDGERLFDNPLAMINDRLALARELRWAGEPHLATGELEEVLARCAQKPGESARGSDAADVAAAAGAAADASIQLARVHLDLSEPQQALDILNAVSTRGTPVEARLGILHRQGVVAALNALGTPEKALALLHDEWIRAAQKMHTITWDDLVLCLELAQQRERTQRDDIIELLEPRIPQFVEHDGADGYYTLEAMRLFARELTRYPGSRVSEAAAILESCLALVSDPAHAQHWQVQAIEAELLENALKGDREMGLAVARRALARNDWTYGDDRHLFLFDNIARLTRDDPVSAVAAAEEFTAAVRSRQFVLWDERVRLADYALAEALEADPQNRYRERALSVRESVLSNALWNPQPEPDTIAFARFHVARLSSEVGDYPRAIALLEAIVANHDGPAAMSEPLRIECQQMLADAYLGCGRVGDALDLIERTSAAAAARFARADSRRTAIEEAAERIRTVAARGPWDPSSVAPDV